MRRSLTAAAKRRRALSRDLPKLMHRFLLLDFNGLPRNPSVYRSDVANWKPSFATSSSLPPASGTRSWRSIPATTSSRAALARCGRPPGSRRSSSRPYREEALRQQGFCELRDRDSNPNFRIQSPASYH